MGPIRHTLLTGGTGLLGRILLADLMRAGLPVAVLARPGRDSNARFRINRQLQHLENLLGRTFPRPVVLQGELTQKNLGLSSSDQSWLRDHCDRILHSGAYVSFKPATSHPKNEPFTTNVEGTARLAEFCLRLGIGEFHHISSSFACGLREGLVLESDGAMGQSFSNDYEASKCQAEEQLRSLSGLTSLTVYRPSIVIDPTPGSLQQGDRTIYLAFSIYQLLSQRIGLLPNPGELLQQLGLLGTERKNIVPVAWVSRMIVQIMRRPALHGRTYHLTHPTGTSLIDLMTSFHDALTAAGYATLQRKITESDFGELAGLVEQFLGTFAPYFRDDPRFDQSELNNALRVCQEAPCPDVDRATLREIARQQLTRKTEFEPSKESDSLTPWEQLQLEFRSSPIHHSIPLIGLTLSGKGGGDWILGRTHQGELTCRQGYVETEWTAYSTTLTWNQLLKRQITLSEASRQGKVLLESAGDNHQDCAVLSDSFEQLLDSFIERVEVPDGRAKVTLHGN